MLIMHMKNLYKAIVVLSIILCLPGVVLAHGEGGLEISQTIDGIVVDLDYDRLIVEAKGDVGRFTFDLFKDETRTERIEFTDLWVRISKVEEGKKTGALLFAGPVDRSIFGRTGFSYAFFEPGQYIFSVRYMDGENKIVEGDFPVDVYELATKKEPFINKDMGIGLIAGVLMPQLCIITFFVWRKVRYYKNKKVE